MGDCEDCRLNSDKLGNFGTWEEILCPSRIWTVYNRTLMRQNQTYSDSGSRRFFFILLLVTAAFLLWWVLSRKTPDSRHSEANHPAASGSAAATTSPANTTAVTPPNAGVSSVGT